MAGQYYTAMFVTCVILACITGLTTADQGYGTCVGCSSRRESPFTGCRDCVVQGELYPTKSNFSYIDDCYRFNCRCECDGSYTCPPKDSEYLCGVFDRGKDLGCAQCFVNGQYHPGGEKFSYTDGCYRLNCDCGCDGSYRCPPKDSEYLCGPVDKDQSETCRRCIIHGQTFEGNTEFTLRNGCIEYSKCRCNCSGEWNCFEDKIKNICGGSHVRQIDRSKSLLGRTSSLRGTCKSCSVRGVLYPPNRPFDYRRGCEEMTDCFCSCDGSYACKVKRNTCTKREQQTSSSRQSSSLSDSRRATPLSQGISSGYGSVTRGAQRNRNRGACDVEGRRIDGGTYFKYTNNCIEYDACFCRKDGYWQCPAQEGRNVCSGSVGSGLAVGSQSRDGCQSCEVGGILRRGNSEFTYRNNCIEWTNCRCECDGSWSCLPERATWICDNICRQCEIDGVAYNGNSEFRYQKDCVQYDPCMCHCNGSWDCPAENGKWVCVDKCLQCDVNGRQIEGNTNFTSRDNCWEWDPCICNCDGSWECPKENARWVCNDRCLECNVEGKSYQGRSQFQLQRDCFQYNCDCNCDGSWNCPAERTIDTCNMNVETGCYYCNVHGERFEGDSTFTHTDGCIRYENCSCNCDSSWNCPGRYAIDTCRQNVSTGCYFCDVNGQRIQGDSSFELEQDCWKFKCSCGCDGGWSCSASQASYICGTQMQVGQCFDCLINGERYQTRSRFSLQWGCIEYNCQCNCDGSWTCPVSNARITCSSAYFNNFQIKAISSAPSTWCKECFVNGAIYPGNSQFEYVDGCVKHLIRCYCDGGYQSKSVMISECVSRTRGISSSSNFSIVAVNASPGNCQQCIMNGKTYPVRSTFEIVIACTTYTCRCRCSGIPSCTVQENLGCGSKVTVANIRRGQGINSGIINVGNTRTRVISGNNRNVNRGRVEGSVTLVPRPGRVIPGSGNTRTRVTGSVISGNNRNVNRGRVEGSVTLVPRPGRVISGSGNTRTRVSGSVISGNNRNVNRERVEGSVNLVPRPGRVISGSGSSIINTRRTGGTSVVVSESGGVVPADNNCFPCFVEGQRYSSNSQFDYVRGCVRYTCSCDCNGKAFCQPSGFEACRENVGPQCRPCVVLGQRHRPNDRFEIERGCAILSCLCECRGRPMCIRKPIPNCDPNRNQERCQECIVDGQRHSPNTVFPVQRDCLRYTCQCLCTGEHKCTSPINTCGQPDGGCRSCIVNGNSYSVNQQFQHQHGCWRMQCKCLCNGDYSCDREGGTYTCDDDRNTRCRKCRVDGVLYPPERKFEKREGCYMQKCHCFCDGTHTCTSTRQNLCNANNKITGTVVSVIQRGSKPQVTKKEITTVLVTGKSQTNRTRTPVNVSPVKIDRTGSTPSPIDDRRPGRVNSNGCSTCMADGKRRAGNSTFFVERRCSRYNCRCYCTGRYACKTDSPINICDNQGRRIVDRPQTPNRGEIRTQTNERRRSENSRRRQSAHDANRRRPETSTIMPQIESPSGTVTPNIDRESEIEGSRTRTGSSINVTRVIYFDRYEQRDGRSSVQITAGDRRAGRCGICVIGDRRYRGRTEFYYDDECKRFRCRCNCDGSWNCPRQQPQNTCVSKCKNCVLRGREYPTQSDFQIDFDECRRYQCTCPCSGQHRCYDVINTCDEPVRCETCRVNGQSYPPNQDFQYRQDCTMFTCKCDCNGVHTCTTENVCPVDPVEPETCQNCLVERRMYRTKSSFRFDKGCSRFSCQCFCNGSYYCPESETQNICNNERNECRQCVRNDVTYQPRTPFQYTENCYRYNCYCNCNGTWACPADRTENICQDECKECVVNRRRYRSNSQFQYDEGCYRYTCNCSCDGSYNCPAERTVNKCERRCTQCEVEGNRYEPNRDFHYERGCDRFNCRCECDGSFVCPPERTQNICGRGNERDGSRIGASGGSITREGSRVSNSSIEISGSGSRGCVRCEVEGRVYRPNSRFRFDKNCFRFDCDCECDGSWKCPPQRSQRTCRDTVRDVGEGNSRRCTMCVIGQNRYEPNTDFSFDIGCYRYNCHCSCGGNWSCPVERTQQICGGAVDNQEGDANQCKQCHVYGNNYAPETRFQFTEGCNRFDCDCFCDGSWNCPQERTQKTCDNDRNNGGCNQCEVDGRRYKPQSRFQFDRGCVRFDCDCYCNGSYVCPAERSQKLCDDRGQGRDTRVTGCKECVRKNMRYQPNTIFQVTEDCTRLTCKCSCDGSYECPAESSENVCSPTKNPASCQTCDVAGRTHRALSDFRYSDDCHQYRCRCHCNGTTTCHIERSRSGCIQNNNASEAKHSACQRCRVKGRQYRPRSRFQYTDGCERYDCRCNCDGSWECPARYTVNICGNDNGSKCKDCEVRGTKYSGNSIFVLREQCLQYSCQCNCDGKWECPDERTVNVC